MLFFLSFTFIDTVTYTSISSPHVCTKSSTILFKYLLTLQTDVLGFQT